MVLRKSFYIRWSAGRSPRVHEVNPGRDPSDVMSNRFLDSLFIPQTQKKKKKIVFFLQLHNYPYYGLSSQTQTNLQFVFQLNCMPFIPYSVSICVSVYAKILFFEKEQNYLFNY